MGETGAVDDFADGSAPVIESVTVEPLDLPLEDPFEISLGTQHEASNVLVTVQAGEVTGYGEGSPIPPVTGETQRAAVETARAMTELLFDEPIGDYRRLIDKLQHTFPNTPAATLAVETALLDAFCRWRSIPLSELFGSSPHPVRTDYTIGITPPERARELASRTVDRGFDSIKIKTGSSVTADVERVVAVAEAAPNAMLLVDANQGWTPKETLRFDEQIRDCGVDLALIEQPVAKTDITGLAETRRRTTCPIGADEAVFTPADAIRVVRAEAADVINVKLGKSGVLRAADIVAVATAADLKLMVGCMLESAIGVHTAAHLVAGTGAFAHVDLDANRLLAEDVIDSADGPEHHISGLGHGIVPEER